jgi:hypothetical protein
MSSEPSRPVDPEVTGAPRIPVSRAAPHASAPGRPGRAGYVIGAGLAALGVVGGITLFIVLLLQLTHRSPADDSAFGNGAATTVSLRGGESKTIYVTPTGVGGISCRVDGGTGQQTVAATPYESQFTLNQWRAVYTVDAERDGDYTIRCFGPADARYGIAEHVGFWQFVPPFIAAASGGIAVVVGVVMVIVTAVRRIRAMSRA